MAKFHHKKSQLRMFKAQPANKAVKAGLHQLQIENLADDGRGVARVDGKTVFVSGALAGETVSAQYSSQRKSFDEADCRKIIDAAPQRREPKCKHFGSCGGCSLQHLDYPAQLAHKQQRLQRLLQPLLAEGVDSALSDIPIEAAEYGYRHRLRLAVFAKGKHFTLGFRRANSHQLEAIETCAVAHPAINELLPALSAALASLAGRSNLRELLVIEDGRGQLALQCQSAKPFSEADNLTLQDFADTHRLQLSFAVEGQPVARSKTLNYRLENQGLDLSFEAGDFTQVNTAINQRMIEQLLSWLDLQAEDAVADFFCGVGNFSLPLAQRAGSVVAFEAVQSMVDKAIANAERNKLTNCDFKVANLFSDNLSLKRLALKTVDKVLLDPPRAGAEALCKLLVKSEVGTVAYVSCNPQTLIRDAQILQAGGFAICEVLMADMFPQTNHIEVLMLLRRPA